MSLCLATKPSAPACVCFDTKTTNPPINQIPTILPPGPVRCPSVTTAKEPSTHLSSGSVSTPPPVFSSSAPLCALSGPTPTLDKNQPIHPSPDPTKVRCAVIAAILKRPTCTTLAISSSASLASDSSTLKTFPQDPLPLPPNAPRLPSPPRLDPLEMAEELLGLQDSFPEALPGSLLEDLSFGFFLQCIGCHRNMALDLVELWSDKKERFGYLCQECQPQTLCDDCEEMKPINKGWIPEIAPSLFFCDQCLE